MPMNYCKGIQNEECARILREVVAECQGVYKEL